MEDDPKLIATSPASSRSESLSSKNVRPQRKPAPLVALTDLELPDARYPPFDPEDPFASLVSLRHRSRSYSYNGTLDAHHSSSSAFQDLADCAAAPPAVKSPLEIPLTEKAFPSGLEQRYTLTVDLPGPLCPFDIVPRRGRVMYEQMSEGPRDIESDRQDALAKLTGSSRASSPGASSGRQQPSRKAVKNNKDSNKDLKVPVPRESAKTRNRSRSYSVGPSSTSMDRDHHRRYTQIATLFREHSAPELKTQKSEKPVLVQKSHYLPRKASTFSYMYTPPLTPDLSGDSSFTSTSSLVIESDPAPPLPPLPTPEGMPVRPKSPLDSAPQFVRKLLTRRSTTSNLRVKKSLDTKDLPPLPISITTTTNTDAEELAAPNAPSELAPTEDTSPQPDKAASKSEETLAVSDVSRVKATPSPNPMKKKSLQSMRERITTPTVLDVDDSASEPDLDPSFMPNKVTASGISLPLKNKLFSFHSRSILRSRVDLYDVKGKVPSPFSDAPFDEDVPPIPKQLETAAELFVINEHGVRVRFGDIWEYDKTLVVFIRHFRASPCQDYVRSIASEVDIEALKKAGLKFVIIGMGSHTLIGPYKKLTGTKVPIFTDPTLTLHQTLGMTLRSTNTGSAAERGHYVSTSPSFARALRDVVTRHRMLPIFERGGDASQLGGEFILGPGLTGSEGGCHFAHRMRHTRGHAPILDVVGRSGVVTAKVRRFRRGRLEGLQGKTQRRESMEDEDAWMARRRRSLVRMKKKRAARRNGMVGTSMPTTVITATDADGNEVPVPVLPSIPAKRDLKEKKSLDTLLTKRVSVVAEAEEGEEELGGEGEVTLVETQ